MLNTRLVAWALGLFTAVTFIVCVIYGLVTPQSVHMHTFLEDHSPYLFKDTRPVIFHMDISIPGGRSLVLYMIHTL